MRRNLLRGVATLILTGSLAVFMTAIQPTLAFAQSGGSIGSSGTGSALRPPCGGAVVTGCNGGFCIFFGPCGPQIGNPPYYTRYCGCV